VSVEAGQPEPFDPSHLSSEASLNRTLLGALPGADSRWVGRRAFDLLSIDALTKLARCIGLDLSDSDGNVTRVISTALSAGNPRAADQAMRVVAIFGRRLAHLIATLTTPTRIETQDSEWRGAYLRYWTHVDQVWLAGGLTAALGSDLLDVVRAEAHRLGAGCAIEVAPNAGVLALLGAARSRLHPRTHIVVLDFGHTDVKRGIATVRNHQLARLDVLPSRSARALGWTRATDEPVTEFLLDVVTDTIASSQSRFGVPDPCVMVSLASYISQGRQVDSHSAYAELSRRDPRSLDDEITRRTGVPVRLRFLHDGTAAARGVPDPAGSAGLIVLGTALGVGFPPPPRTLLPVSADLLVAGTAENPAV
jgi:hypothetical protein